VSEDLLDKFYRIKADMAAKEATETATGKRMREEATATRRRSQAEADARMFMHNLRANKLRQVEYEEWVRQRTRDAGFDPDKVVTAKWEKV